MSTTAIDRLKALEKYIKAMAPIYRPAILLPPDKANYNKGYDQAMWDAQQEMLKILDG